MRSTATAGHDAGVVTGSQRRLAATGAHEKTPALAVARAGAYVRQHGLEAQPAIRTRAFFVRRFIQSRPARAPILTPARARVAGSGTAATRKPTCEVAVVELRKIPAAEEFQLLMSETATAQLPEKSYGWPAFAPVPAVSVYSVALPSMSKAP
jgi:hypothetical protein